MTLRKATSSPPYPDIIASALIFATIASYIYCAITHQFNGDFYTSEITLSQGMLLMLLPFAIAPHIFGLLGYRAIAIREPKVKVEVSQSFLNWFLLITMVWHISTTLAFGVGIIGREVYSAPGWITPFIKIGNRVFPEYVTVFYILASPKKRSHIIAAFLLIIYGYLRASLGIFLYLFIAFSIKYRNELISFIKRYFVIIMPGIFLLPNIVVELYETRNKLRGFGETIRFLGAYDTIFAVLIGRLSSYSNLGFIVQHSDYFYDSVQSLLPPMYYLQQVIGSLFSGKLIPLITPEKLLLVGKFMVAPYRVTDYSVLFGYYSHMSSVSGNLLLSWYLSPLIMVINFLIMITLIYFTLLLSRHFANGCSSALGIALLLYPLTSGVANEFAMVFLNVLFIYILCYIMHIRRYTYRNFSAAYRKF